MTTARTIITLALEGMNRLAPGEVIDADLAAMALRRLNAIADGWSAGRDMMPQELIVSGAVTGQSLTLGVGLFASIAPGDEIVAAQADGYAMAPITMQQYNNIIIKSQGGRPDFFAPDGLSTVYLYPTSVGNTINLLVRKSFTAFADLDTNYVMPSGYLGAFAASLSVALAPTILGNVPPDLVKAKKEAMFAVRNSTIRPAMISCTPLARNNGGTGNILQGFR